MAEPTLRVRNDGPTAPPIRTLLWAAQRVAGSQDRDLLERPDQGDPRDVDWSDVLRDAIRHGVLPLLHRALADRHDLVPALLAHDLATRYEAGRRRNLHLAAELVQVVRHLDAAGVAAVPWKGPLLAERTYGDLAMRTFYDLDVLVPRRAVWNARDTLVDVGFRTEKPMTPAQQARYVAQQGELELVRDEDGLWVELHWAVVPDYYAPARNDRHVDGMWQRLVPARVARAPVQALALEDELEALCVHGSKHRWERLMWIVDVAMMLRSHAELDLEMVLERAARHGTRRMVHLGLLLAADVCGARLPDGIAETARADRGAVTLATEVKRGLAEPRHSRLDRFLFHARMHERPRDQARFALNVMFTPSGADWETLALPERLFPLYGLTRPFRLGYRYGRTCWRATRSRAMAGRGSSR